MESRKVYCAYIDGMCLALAMDDLPNINDIKRDWIKTGVKEIKLLDIETAKKEFLAGLEKREYRKAGG